MLNQLDKADQSKLNMLTISQKMHQVLLADKYAPEYLQLTREQ